MPTYTMYLSPADSEMNYLKSVEQKFEIGGLLLGPFWILFKKGPILLAIFLLALAAIPIVVWGVTGYTLAWAAVIWAINSRSHAGLQAMRLKSIGYERVGDVFAATRAEAEDHFRSQAGSPAR